MFYLYSLQFITVGFAMNDIDKRDIRRKKFLYPKGRDENFSPKKVVSRNNDVHYNHQIKQGKLSQSENTLSSVPRRTIMLRQKDEGESHSTIPSIPCIIKQKKENSVNSDVKLPCSVVPKAIAVDHCDVARSVPQLNKSVCLIEDGQFAGDAILDYLTEQNEFLVVGCLGLQGVGKSTLMSELIGRFDGKSIFSAQNFDNIISSTHGTSNIDLYITENRVFFLDTPPLLSPSIMDSKNINLETKKLSSINQSCTSGGSHVPVECFSEETAMEIYSLQLTSFILSVCHVVILVQDWCYDPNILRFIQSAEMLKPPTTTSINDSNLLEEYFPHIIFLQNKGQFSDYTPDSVSMMQEVYSQMFVRSRLRVQSGIGIASGFVTGNLNPDTCGDPMNLYILPDTSKEESKEFPLKNHPGYSYLINKLRRDIYGITKYPLTSSPLTEKDWFRYCNTVWGTIKKSNFFMEYNKLLSP